MTPKSKDLNKTLDSEIDDLLFGFAQYVAGAKNGQITPEEATAKIKALIQTVGEGLINKNYHMTFSDQIPTFNSLEEYMEHVGTIRDVLRAEHRKNLKNLLGGS